MTIDYSDLEIENVAQWPKLAQRMVVLALFVALNGAGYFIYLTPKLEVLDVSINREVELKSDVVTKMNQAAKLPIFKDQLQELHRRGEALVHYFPQQKELASLLAAVNNVGLESNLTFTRIEWGKKQQQPFFYRLPLNIELTGTYDDIADFSQRIAELPRLILFDHVKWQRVSEGSQTLHLRIKAYTYQFKSESDQLKSESDDAS